MAEGAARASAGEGKENCSSQGSSRNPPLCLPPGTLELAPLGWWPYLRVLHCPKGFSRAVRWGPSSGPLKERRNTVISPGVWLITHLRTEAQASLVSIVRYYRTGGNASLKRGAASGKAAEGCPWGGRSESPQPALSSAPELQTNSCPPGAVGGHAGSPDSPGLFPHL